MSADPAGVRTYAAEGGEVVWEAARCRHAAECVRGLPAVFDTGKRPWIQPEHAPGPEVERVVGLCPTHALTWRATPDDRAAADPDTGASDAAGPDRPTAPHDRA